MNKDSENFFDKKITLEHIDDTAAQKVKEMLEVSFCELLCKYKDYDTSPACEELSSIRNKINTSDYYFIKYDKTIVGAIRIINKGESCHVSPVFILPKYRNKGYARQAMLISEKMYPDIFKWELDTIKQEEYLVKLYKELGYTVTGREYDIKPGMTIIFMEKNITAESL